MTPELVLCGHPVREGFEPCPLEKGHDGEHLFWSQSVLRRRKVAVWVYSEDGQAVFHADSSGPFTAEEVCALLAFGELARSRS